MQDLSSVTEDRLTWPEEGVSRVPFRIFTDEAVYADEQDRVFKGEVWNFIGLEQDVPKVGDYKRAWVGETPVVLVRSREDGFTVFVNRCAHRGSLLCIEERGSVKRFTCVYHNWSYDLEGRLKAVAFHRGVRGQGGMPPEFNMEEHHLRSLRVARLGGLVFATFSADTPPLEDFLGQRMVDHMQRVFHRPIRVLGTYSQLMHNNWKLYMENVKDSYHASLLHLFFTTFGLNRLSMRGGLILEGNGGHHISYSQMASDQVAGTDYESGSIRANNKDFGLHDPSLIQSWQEFDDGITHAIQGIFPNLIVQQIQNSLAIRLLVPRGPQSCELFWILFGYEDDTEEQNEMRIKQSNLVGPAGLVSLEDGVIGSFVQRTLDGERTGRAVLEMGGRSVEDQESRVSEASVRGFWQCYRGLMGL